MTQSYDLEEALLVLNSWSKTFGVPIAMLPISIKEATVSLYLSLRAIDEIEDCDNLTITEKKILLQSISLEIQSSKEIYTEQSFEPYFAPYKDKLADVTLNLHKWLMIAPPTIAIRIWETVSNMSDRMIYWIEKNWVMSSEKDLVSYSYAVGGAVAITLADLWTWFDKSDIDRRKAISYGIFLQCVNIIRGFEEDKNRGISYLPPNWNKSDIIELAKKHLVEAKYFTDPIQTRELKEAADLVMNMSIEALLVIELGEKIEFDGIDKP